MKIRAKIKLTAKGCLRFTFIVSFCEYFFCTFLCHKHVFWLIFKKVCELVGILEIISSPQVVRIRKYEVVKVPFCRACERHVHVVVARKNRFVTTASFVYVNICFLPFRDIPAGRSARGIQEALWLFYARENLAGTAFCQKTPLHSWRDQSNKVKGTCTALWFPVQRSCMQYPYLAYRRDY
jgi:hypothetical protein